MTETIETLDNTVQEIKELAALLEEQMKRAGIKVDNDQDD